MKIPRTNLRLNKENIKCVLLSHGLWKVFKRCRQCGGRNRLDIELPFEYESGVLWRNLRCIKCGNVSTKEECVYARNK